MGSPTERPPERVALDVRDGMVSVEAARKMKPGEVSGVVETNFGYHIIRLDDTRTVKFPPLTEVRGRIQQQLSQRKVEEHIRTLRAKAKIE